MRLEQAFTVPVPVDEAWRVLVDLPRIAPCMPGATVTGVDGDTFTGTVKVKVGPISLTYRGQGRFVERDEAARRVVVEARGKDVRAAGTAAATVTAVLSPAGDVTSVDVVTELTVTGRPAQFGRGMINEVSGKLLTQFADCLADTLGHGDTPTPDAPTPDAPAPDGPASGASVAVSLAQEGSPVGASRPTGQPSGAEAQADAPPPAQADAPRPAPADREAEAVDLLRIAGGTDAARRLAVRGGVVVVVLALLAWLVVRWLRD